MSNPERDFEAAACRVCGCTEDDPCEGGCSWLPDPGMGELCSACLDRVYQALQRVFQGKGDAVDSALLARFAEVELPPPPAVRAVRSLRPSLELRISLAPGVYLSVAA